MHKTLYSTAEWRRTRARAIERDRGTCTVSRLLGGRCSSGPLHVHHIIPLSEGGDPLDLDNLGTSCSHHHPRWEALRRAIVNARLSIDEATRARTRALGRAEVWARSAGAHIDRESEIEEELFGRHGRARALADDDVAREHLLREARRARHQLVSR
jgi:hypothetical protein